MRRTGWIAVAAVLVTTVGCGAGSAQHKAASDVDVVKAAYGKAVDARTAKMSLVESVNASGQNLKITASGAFDMTGRRATMTMQVPQAGSFDMRMLGHVIYLRMPEAMRGMAGGKQWMSLDLDALMKQQTGATLSQLQGLTDQDPSQFMNMLQGVSNDVHRVGTDTLRGVKTTHYKATLSLTKALDRIKDPDARASAQRMYEKYGITSLPADIWVSDDGLPRRVKLAMSGLAKQQTGGSGAAVDMDMEFYDYGTAVSVTAPPADQTADLTKVLGNLGGARVAG